MREEEKVETNEMGTKSILSLFEKFFFMAVLMGLALCATIVAEGIFVGSKLGPESIGAIGFLYPIICSAAVFPFLFGPSGASQYAYYLGEGRKDEAKKVFTTSVLAIVIVQLILTVVIMAFNSQVAYALGGRGEMLDLMKAYILIYMPFGFITAIGSTVYYFAKADGRPSQATIASAASAALVILVEYVGMYHLNMGIKAASMGASLIYAVNVVLLIPFFTGKASVKVSLKDFRISMEHLKKITVAGIPTTLLYVAPIITATIVNNQLISKGATALEVAGYGMVNGYVFAIMTQVGFAGAGAFQPIVGYNLGNKKYGRVRQVISTAVIFNVCLIGVMLAALYLFPNQIIGLFLGGDAEAIAVAIPITHKYTTGLIIGILAMVMSYYYQTLEKTALSLFFVLGRTFIFFLPLLFILPSFMGIDGIWYSFSGAEIITGVIAIVFLIKESRKLAAQEAAEGQK